MTLIKAPIKGGGDLEIEEAAGRCAFSDCKVNGGGLLKFTILDELSEGIFRERPVVICGGCLTRILTTVVQPAK